MSVTVAIGVSHFSLRAADIKVSAAFYTNFFGFKRIQAPNFGTEVVWLARKGFQLHLYRGDQACNVPNHVGLIVEEIEPIYLAAKHEGYLDKSSFGHPFRRLSSGEYQVYLRDPGGNLVEVNAHPDQSLSAEAAAEVVSIEDEFAQTEAQKSARLLP